MILGSGASKKLLARCGGQVASPAKPMAARQNALKGGRLPKERGHALAVLTHCVPPEFDPHLGLTRVEIGAVAATTSDLESSESCLARIGVQDRGGPRMRARPSFPHFIHALRAQGFSSAERQRLRDCYEGEPGPNDGHYASEILLEKSKD